MAKANILEFFAWLNLIVGGLIACLFLYRGFNSISPDAGTVLIGLGVFCGSLLQFAVIGGLGEIIKRLVKIDENTDPSLGLPPPTIPKRTYPIKPDPQSSEVAPKPVAPADLASPPAIGRSSR